jgi:Arc/MetJ-type ribon-helix-helix transcriptional regulator
MTLNVPSEYHDILQNAVASGAFSDPNSALRHALELLASEQSKAAGEEVDSRESVDLEQDDWEQRLRSFAARHKTTGYLVDDSRESIYPDRI